MPPSSDSWARPARHPELAPDEVHVWCARLDQPPHVLSTLRELLAPDELARADRYHFEKDERHFVAGRGLLRTLVGRYLRRPPAELRFDVNAYGKPALNGGGPLNFNLSHAHGLALYAFAHARAVGVDIEHIQTEVECAKLAGRFFSTFEVRTLLSLPAESQREAFFNCWTRKEAYIKARGEGLSRPLAGFDVSLAPGEPAALLRTDDEEEGAARWTLRELSVPKGYVAALAVEGEGWSLRRWQWSG
ncbi:MAG TPA: 4'-phosphopantetheinyl transferase superfamily protein [Pyrinomonadaceae bacterium]